MALRSLKSIKELRFILCQSNPQSEHLRKYLANNYEAIRESATRITVRECENSAPTAIATFPYGVEKSVSLKKMEVGQIDRVIQDLEAYSEELSVRFNV